MLKFHRTSFRLPAELLSHCDIFQNTVITCTWRFISKLRKKTSSTFFSMNEAESRAIEVMFITCSSAVLTHPKFKTHRKSLSPLYEGMRPREDEAALQPVLEDEEAEETFFTGHGAYRFCTSRVWICWAQQKEPPLDPQAGGGSRHGVQKGSSKDPWHWEREGRCSLTVEGKQQHRCHENCGYPH